jgi:hypothetical protein
MLHLRARTFAPITALFSNRLITLDFTRFSCSRDTGADGGHRAAKNVELPHGITRLLGSRYALTGPTPVACDAPALTAIFCSGSMIRLLMVWTVSGAADWPGMVPVGVILGSQGCSENACIAADTLSRRDRPAVSQAAIQQTARRLRYTVVAMPLWRPESHHRRLCRLQHRQSWMAGSSPVMRKQQHSRPSSAVLTQMRPAPALIMPGTAPPRPTAAERRNRRGSGQFHDAVTGAGKPKAPCSPGGSPYHPSCALWIAAGTASASRSCPAGWSGRMKP